MIYFDHDIVLTVAPQLGTLCCTDQNLQLEAGARNPKSCFFLWYHYLILN